MEKVIVYQSYICQVGGVETFLYNWCYSLRKFFDITLVYGDADVTQLYRFKKIVKTERYDSKKEYTCDIFLRNSVWGRVPRNIKGKRNIEMRHANYKYLFEKGKLKDQYFEMGIKEIVACGEFVGKMSNEVLHDNPTVIRNILAPKKKTNKIIKLISCTRIDPEKGWNRMKKMMDMMRDAGIKFEWKIFTNGPQPCEYEEVRFYKQRFDIWDYLADADYTVLLSDCEGLPYTVQESLQYQTPCIVTNIEGCTELIKDGVNGYVVPLDMNFDINIIKDIPKCEEYKSTSLEDWLKYLEYDISTEDINKEKIKLEKEYNTEKRYKVGVVCKRPRGYDDILLKKHIMPEDGEYYVSEKRANYLASEDVVEILEFIEEK